jgi:hypothetical protein
MAVGTGVAGFAAAATVADMAAATAAVMAAATAITERSNSARIPEGAAGLTEQARR